MKPTTIKFNDTSASSTASASPWAAPAKSAYQDKILKPGFAAKRYKFPLGTTWLRIVPALPESGRGWMLGIHALNYAGGRHAHPKTVVPKARSVFDHAYGWCKENCKESLYAKANKEGFRLLADPLCLFWMLIEEGGKTTAHLLMESGYDGSRGGTPGLGYQIWKLTRELAEGGDPLANPADPSLGAQICVEKKQAPGARYPSYSLRLGRIPAPIDDMIAKMEPEEVATLTPLEQVIHLPAAEEEWELLENVIDAHTVARIRTAVG